jgi:isocitrate/isopropylmalate dehydrogenase
MLLEHIGEQVAAQRIKTAIVSVLEAGEVRTGDLGGRASTTDFTQAIIAALPTSNPTLLSEEV